MTARVVSDQFQTSGRPRKYDWDKWTDGQIREMDCSKIGTSAIAFRSSVYHYAKQCGMSAETSVNGEKVRFRIFSGE